MRNTCITILFGATLATEAADGVWLGSTSNASPQGTYTNVLNWAGGVVGQGVGATAVFDYDPISDGGSIANNQKAGGLIISADFTAGHFIFNDRDGFGSATIGFNNLVAASPQTLTLATTGEIPSMVAGQLLNAQTGGKKVVVNQFLSGSQGLLYTGAAHTSFRAGPSSLGGPLRVEGGSLEIQRPFPNLSAVQVSGGNLQLGFGNTANSATATDLLGTPALTLGGSTGGGTLFNSSNFTSLSTVHSQSFTETRLKSGYSWVQANTVTNATTNANMAYNLGQITFGPGSALNYAKPTPSGVGNLLLTNANDPTGIVSPRLLFQTANWAVNNGAGALAGFTGYQVNTLAAGAHTSATLSLDTGAIAETQTLRMDNGYPVDVTLNRPFTLRSGGIISRQGSNRIRGAPLTSALDAGDGTVDLIVHANSGGNATGLQVDAAVVDNGTTPLRLVKGLLGNLTLATNNTYSAGTVLGGGNTIVGVGPQGGAEGSLGSGPVSLGQIGLTGTQHVPNGQLSFNRAGTYELPNAINPDGNAGGLLAQQSPGTLVIKRTARIGGFVAQAGTTRLDFSAPSAPANELLDGSFTGFTNSLHTARLYLRQGGLQLVGAAGVTNTQTFALTDLRGYSILELKPDAAPGSALSLGLGAFTPRLVNNTDGYGLLALRGVGPSGRVTTTLGTAGALIQDGGTAYVTVNDTDWGAKDAANARVVAGSSLPGFYTPAAGALAGGTLNYDYVSASTMTGTNQVASLRVATNVAATVTINAGSQLRLGGLLVTPAAGAASITVGGAGSLAANNTGNRDLPVFHHGAGVLSFATPVANHSSGNVTSLLKAGPGTLELKAANTTTGRLVVHEGLVRLTGSANWGTAATRSSNVHLRGGELELNGTSSVFSGAFLSVGQLAGNNGVLTLRGGSALNVSSDVNVGDVNAGGVLNIGDTATLTAKSFYAGKVGYAAGTVNQSGGSVFAGNTPANDWNFGGNGVEDIAARGVLNISGGRFDAGGQNFQVARYGIGVANQTGGTVSGAGFAVIGRQNTGTGTWNISAGTIDFTATASPGITATAKEYFIVAESGRGVLNLSGTGTLKARSVSIGHNGGRGTFTISGGTADLTATAALTGGIQPGVVFGAGAGAVPAVSLPGGAAGTLVLSGGVLRAAGITERTVSGIDSTVLFDGTVWQAVTNTVTALQGLDRALVSDGGAIINTAAFNLTASQPLLHDPSLGAAADGGLEKRGAGSLILTGTTSSTFTGPTVVTAGILQLNGTPGTDRVSARVVVQNGATLTRSAASQIPDVASVAVNGTGVITGTVADTLDTLVLNSTAQNQLSGLTVTNLTTITGGILHDVNSGTTFTTRRMAMTNTVLRLGANTGNTAVNVGSGGLDLDASTLQLGSGGAAFEAVVNLGGDVTSSGASAISSPNQLGARAIDLQATNRVLVVRSGTLSVGGNLRNGGLVKRGAGTLALGGPNHTHAGVTRIEQGALALTGVSTNNVRFTSAIVVGAGATLNVTGLAGGTLNLATGQTLAGTGSVVGSLVPEAGSSVAPGDGGIGTLTTGTAVFRAGSALGIQINSSAGTCDRLKVNGVIGFTNGVTLAVADLSPGSPAVGAKFALVEYSAAWNGGLLSDASGTPLADGDELTLGALRLKIDYDDTTDGVNAGNFVTLTVVPSATPFQSWIASFGVLPPNDGMLADADGDGEANVLEFALNGNPTNGVANARRLADVSTVATNGFLYTTIPVRNGAVFSGAPVLESAPVDGFTYLLEGSENLSAWTVPVVEHSPAITNNLPAVEAGWTYRTFRFAEPLAHPRSRGYLRVGAEPAP